MQTPTHAIIALALLAKNGDPKRTRICLWIMLGLYLLSLIVRLLFWVGVFGG